MWELFPNRRHKIMYFQSGARRVLCVVQWVYLHRKCLDTTSWKCSVRFLYSPSFFLWSSYFLFVPKYNHSQKANIFILWYIPHIIIFVFIETMLKISPLLHLTDLLKVTSDERIICIKCLRILVSYLYPRLWSERLPQPGITGGCHPFSLHSVQLLLPASPLHCCNPTVQLHCAGLPLHRNSSCPTLQCALPKLWVRAVHLAKCT